jgi:hypothetical protein
VPSHHNNIKQQKPYHILDHIIPYHTRATECICITCTWKDVIDRYYLNSIHYSLYHKVIQALFLKSESPAKQFLFEPLENKFIPLMFLTDNFYNILAQKCFQINIRYYVVSEGNDLKRSYQSYQKNDKWMLYLCLLTPAVYSS